MTAARTLPGGTLTFMFTDIEGSTEMVRSLGIPRWHEVLEDHARLMRFALAAHGGTEVRVEGDSFFAVFTSPAGAVAAAAAAQRAFASHHWPHSVTLRVRIGLHTGEAQPASAEAGADYVGFEVHRAARIAAAPHGGQTLLSETTRALVMDSLPFEVTLRDLGEHQLKDLRVERLFQLDIAGMPSEFPPLRTLDRTPNNLPTQLTSFIGRDGEIGRSTELLRAHRLLTLTGPGGVGKTRLALQVAASASSDFPEGVYFVPLAPIVDPSLVPSAIIHAVGIPVSSKRPPLDLLVDHLRNKTSLLVLDNFEHLLEAATTVGGVLRGCPGTKVLATSRASLALSGEQEFPVPPLELPDADASRSLEAFSQYEAVRLFVERASAARPDFSLTSENARTVGEICARLDGLPLAIELAAVRVRILSPQAILGRLENRLALLADGARDLPLRQRTLRAAIAWSYELLDDHARRTFARLSVFAGGAALPQAGAVCAEPGQEAEVFDGLVVLATQSLLRQRDIDGEPRFTMLQTIREFAEERLVASGDAAAARSRHATTFLELAEGLASLTDKSALERLSREHDNLRSALAWSIANADAGTSLRLLAALWRFWQIRGHLHEARDRARQVLAVPWSDADIRARIGGLEAAAGIAYWQNDMGEAEALYGEALELARQLGDPAAIALLTQDLAFVVMWPTARAGRDLAKARALLGEAEELYERLGDPRGIARSRVGKAMVQLGAGDYESVKNLLTQAIPEFRREGDTFSLGWALNIGGEAAIRRGEFGLARESFEEALKTGRAASGVSNVALDLYEFASLAQAEGQRERALRLAGAANAMGASSGIGSLTTMFSLDAMRVVVPEPAEPTERALYDEGAALSLEDAIEYALRG
jgi:predicted ATPase/class 3 adenylate cyclase